MGPKKKKAGPSKPMTFGQAFAKNRKAGKKTCAKNTVQKSG